MSWVYDGENFHKLQQELGPRPGGYRTDPNYLRRGIANKPYFWNAYKKKWLMLKIGDLIYINDEGYPIKSGMESNGQETG